MLCSRQSCDSSRSVGIHISNTPRSSSESRVSVRRFCGKARVREESEFFLAGVSSSGAITVRRRAARVTTRGEHFLRFQYLLFLNDADKVQLVEIVAFIRNEVNSEIRSKLEISGHF